MPIPVKPKQPGDTSTAPPELPKTPPPPPPPSAPPDIPKQPPAEGGTGTTPAPITPGQPPPAEGGTGTTPAPITPGQPPPTPDVTAPPQPPAAKTTEQATAVDRATSAEVQQAAQVAGRIADIGARITSLEALFAKLIG